MVAAVFAPWAIFFACGGSDPAQIDANDDGGGDGDGANDSAARKDGRVNGSDGAPTTTTYNDFTNGALWSFCDFSALLGQADAGLPVGFLGAIFDGKYMYYTPTGIHTIVGASDSNNPAMLRYDTTAPFDAISSYVAANLSSIGPSLAYIGGAFDGRYIYPAPYQGNPFARLDTKGTFGDLDASWSFGATSSIAHFGAAIGGKYVYYAPIQSSLMDRLDTNDGGIAQFDVGGIAAGQLAYQGVVFDGRYAYFAPSPTTAGVNVSHVLRFDTQADFETAASWVPFDTTQVDPNAANFTGGVFDGRYLYLTPTAFDPLTPTNVRFVRYDTKADFATPGSWQAYAPAPDAQSIAFHTAGFDGRYVYFLPFVETGAFNLVRYDSTKNFNDGAAWTSVDTTKFNAGATGFEGVGFDGRYIYLVPRYGQIAARFDAKSPSSLPPGFFGSFL